MKKYSLILIALILGINFATAQDKMTLSDADISFVFVSKKVKGTISGFSTTSVIDTNDFLNSKLKGSVQTETLDTGNFLRNWSLKGSKYFDVDKYPTLAFESTSIKKNNNAFEVTGQLTIKETTKPITFLFTKEENRLKGTATIYSTDFDIQIIKKSREANKVEILLSFELK